MAVPWKGLILGVVVTGASPGRGERVSKLYMRQLGPRGVAAELAAGTGGIGAPSRLARFCVEAVEFGAGGLTTDGRGGQAAAESRSHGGTARDGHGRSLQEHGGVGQLRELLRGGDERASFWKWADPLGVGASRAMIGDETGT